MFQSGHKNYAQDTSSKEKNHYGEDNWKFVNVDYNKQPVKPTLDGEPSYENIPHGLHDSLEKRWTAADIRRYAYWSVFAGGAGFTYGENAIMQYHKNGENGGSFGVNQDWNETINAPGATQMQFLKKLMLDRSYFDRVPAQDLIINNGEKYEGIIATKGNNYAMFYVYNGREFKVAIDKLGFKPSKASWFDPRNGEKMMIVIGESTATASFDPPGENENGNDWVLILEK
jgi:hypothetical protein